MLRYVSKQEGLTNCSEQYLIHRRSLINVLDERVGELERDRGKKKDLERPPW